MKKRQTRLAQFALLSAISSMALFGCDRNDQATNTTPPGQTTADKVQNAADKTGQALNDAAHSTGQALSNATTRAADLVQSASDQGTVNGSNPSVAPDAKSIRSGVASVVNDALTVDGFSSLVKDFDSNSRNRIGTASDQKFADLDGVITQIQNAWKTKYNDSFDASQASFATDAFNIRQGAYARSDTPNGTQSNIGKATSDRDTAVLTIMPLGTSNQLIVPMKKEGMLESWKVDVPPTIDAAKLHDNLLKELSAVRDSQASWPDDQNAAYRIVATHVLAAVMDMPMTK
jgi:hypothetical protein